MNNPQSLRYASIEEVLSQNQYTCIDIERDEIGGSFGFTASIYGPKGFKDISSGMEPNINEAMKELNSLCADFLENES